MSCFLRCHIFALSLSVLCSCGPSAPTKRSYPKPSSEAIIRALQERDALAQSFYGDSRMEYWVDGQRVKSTVYVMGTRGAKLRLNALNPTGGDTAADLACNGQRFQLVDHNNNCERTGPCNQNTIAQLLHVNLSPNDFFALAIGSAPIIVHQSARLHWDAASGEELLDLRSSQGERHQRFRLRAHSGGWDLLSSTLYDAKDNILWKLTNKNFISQVTEDKKTMRLPTRTRFEQPQNKADLVIRWNERSINLELPADKFQIEMSGLPTCGQAK